jgi:hypothetical protein
MKRADLIRALKGCGAENDRAKFTRLYIENRISRAVADQAWRDGAALRRFVEKRDTTA